MQPDVVIFNGPFLPDNNNLLKSGMIQYGD